MRAFVLNNTSTRGELVRGWSESGDLFASIVTGLLLGLLLDWWLGTAPLFIAILSAVAAIGGFYKAKAAAADKIDAQAAEAIRIRDGL
ncbi:MAG: AtpZ/AtpI family protein [Acidimicrobiia bacterium]